MAFDKDKYFQDFGGSSSDIDLSGFTMPEEQGVEAPDLSGFTMQEEEDIQLDLSGFRMPGDIEPLMDTEYRNTQRVREGLYFSQDVNPEVRTNSLAIQQNLLTKDREYVPVELIEEDLSTFQRRSDDLDQLDLSYRRAPVAVERLSDPYESRIFSKYAPEMVKTETDTATLADAYQMGRLQTEMGQLGWKQIVGEATAEDLAQLKANEQRLAEMHEGAPITSNWVKSIPYRIAEQIPLMSKVTQAGVPYFGLGAVAGAAAGPAAPVTSTALAFTGLAAGATVEMYRLEAGNVYNSLSDLKSPEGETLPHDVKVGLAAFYGFNSALIEFAGDKFLGGTMSKAWKATIKDKAFELLKKPGAMKALAALGRTTGEGMLVNGFQEAFQQVVELETTDVGRQYLGLGDTPFQEKAAAVQQSFAAGSAAGTGIALVPGGITAMAQVQTDNQIKQTRRIAEAYAGIAEDNKFAKEQPERFRQYVQDVVDEHGPATEVGIAVKAFNQIVEDMGIDIEQLFDAMPGTRDSYNQAVEQGGEVKVPVDIYLENLAKVPEINNIVDDIRFHPKTNTINENKQIAKDLQEAADIAVETTDEALVSHFRGRLEGVESGPVAEHLAVLMAEGLQKLGQAAGKTPEQILAEAEKIYAAREDMSVAELELAITRIQEGKEPTATEQYGESLQEFIAREGDTPATREAAIKAGYFKNTDLDPDLQPTPEEFELALNREEPVYAYGAEDYKVSRAKAQIDQLKEIAAAEGIDLAEGTPAEIAEQLMSRRLAQDVGFTEERIDRIVEDYDQKAVIAWVHPNDFIRATTGGPAGFDAIQEEAGQLRQEDLEGEPTTPFLTVDEETGRILGHEGRHRMSALFASGARKVPVIVNYRDRGDRAAGRPLRLLGQEFETTAGTDIDLSDSIPITWENKQAIKEKLGQGKRLFQAEQRISTRFPEGAKATEDPMASPLIIDKEATKQIPKAWEKNVSALTEGQVETGKGKDKKLTKAYLGFKTRKRTPDAIADDYIETTADNLLWIYDQIPQEIRDRSKLWYEGANKMANEWADRYGVEAHAVAAVMAALSPQKDWYQNVSLAERVLDIMTKVDKDTALDASKEEMIEKLKPDTGKMSDDLAKLIDAIQGKKLGQLTKPAEIATWIRLYDEFNNERGYRVVTPEGTFIGEPQSKVAWGSMSEIAKAVKVLEDQRIENVNAVMGGGHKIRNFYNNIIDPDNEVDVTIDTHAVAAQHLRPFSAKSYEVGHNFGGAKGTSSSKISGAKGIYGLNADAYRLAAEKRGIKAREMQSITWEAIRGLFSDTYKRQQQDVAKNSTDGYSDLDRIWLRYEAGKITLDQARQEVLDHAGGITNPSWYRSDTGLSEGSWGTSYEGALSSTGVSPRAAGGLRSRTGGRTPRGTAGLQQVRELDATRERDSKTRPIRSLLRSGSADTDTDSRAYSRRDERDGVDGGLRVQYTPTEELTAALEGAGSTPFAIEEVSDPARFRDSFIAANTSKYAAAVEVKDDYSGMRLFLSENGKAGFAITQDGDIVSVFNSKESGYTKATRNLLALAIEQGGRTLDAFDTVLPHIYSEMGFVAVSRVNWQDGFNDAWDKETFKKWYNGEPDVVLMVYDPQAPPYYDDAMGLVAPDWDTAAAAQTAAVDMVDRGKRLFKREDGKTRGYIDIGQDYYKITLTGKANLSTFLHESGHLFLELLTRFSEDDTAGAQMDADLQTIKDWVGWEEGQTQFTTEQHEQFARGFEAYLMEGKAPSEQLDTAFKRFSAWLKGVYKNFAALNVTLTDDVRGVMDRMLASEEAIRSMAQVQNMQPIFTSAEQANMSDKAYNAYLKQFADALDDSEEELRSRLMAEVKRLRSQKYKNAKKKVTEQATERAQNRPLYRAWHFLKTGKLFDGSVPEGVDKLDREAVKALFYNDKQIVMKLPAGATIKNGGDPDLTALYFGYANAHEMLTDIMKSVPIEQAIRQQVAETMETIFPEAMKNVEQLQEEAARALHMGKVEGFQTRELQAIYENAGRVVPQGFVRAAQKMAEERVNTMTVDELRSPIAFLRAEQKEQKRAFEAAGRGSWEIAADAKRKQILNHWLYRKALAAQKETDKIHRYLATFTNRKKLGRIGKAGGSYLEAITGLLESVDLKKRTRADVARRMTLFEAIENIAKTGDPVQIAEFLKQEDLAKHYSRMSLEQFRALRDAIKNLEHLALNKNKILTAQRKLDAEKADQEMAATVERNVNKGKVGKDYPSEWRLKLERTRDMIRSFDANLWKIEFLIERLDGQTAGLIHKMIFQPIADAQRKKNDIMQELNKTLKKKVMNAPRDQKIRLAKRHTFTGIKGGIPGYRLLALALNMGNEGNLRKLIDGYPERGWTEEQLVAEIDEIFTKEDWDLVQHIWDEVNQFWPEIAAMNKRATGLEPPKVEAREINSKHGTFRGGYYPIFYDKTKDYKAYQNAQKVQADLFENNFMRPNVSSGFTEARTAYTGPLDLDLNRLQSHLNEVVHYITHYEAVQSAYRLTQGKAFRAAVVEGMGQEYYDLFKPWLQNIANDGVLDIDLDEYNKIADHLATGTAIMSMGASLSTASVQLLGLFSGLSRINPAHLTKGWAKIHNRKNWRFIMENSRELPHLMRNFDRDGRKVLNNMLMELDKDPIKRGLRVHAKIVELSFMAAGYTQMYVSATTFMGAYYQALDKGMIESEAIEEADSVVRLTQSSGSAKDLAKVQRSRGWNRVITAFYTYFSALYGLLRESSRKVPSNPIKSMAQLSALWIVPVIVEQVVRDGWPDEGDEDKFMGELGAELFKYPFATMPILGKLVNWGVNITGYGYGYNTAPAIDILARAASSSVSAVRNVYEGEEVTAAQKKNILRGAGVIFKFPMAAPIRATQYLEAYLDGELEEPFREFIFGVKK